MKAIVTYGDGRGDPSYGSVASAMVRCGQMLSREAIVSHTRTFRHDHVRFCAVVVSLLRDIQSSAIGKDASVEVMLRQCLFLAARLKHAELKAWVRRELDGYPADVPLPSYRPRIYTQVLADLAGAFGRAAKNVPFAMTSVPDEWDFVRDLCLYTDVRAAVAEIETLVSSGEQTFTIPLEASSFNAEV